MLAASAAGFAARAHRHQTRKDGVTPYVAHVARVALILAAEFGVADDAVLAAALLHDTIEDCNVDYDEIREHFGGRVYSTVVPRNIRLAEAPSHGQSILQYDIKCRGAAAYLDVAREFLRRVA